MNLAAGGIDVVLSVVSGSDNRAGGLCTQGKDCFGAFMQWGLPKEVLRDVWNLVAKGQGQLDAKQFISCVYFMDSVKKVYSLLAGACVNMPYYYILSMWPVSIIQCHVSTGFSMFEMDTALGIRSQQRLQHANWTGCAGCEVARDVAHQKLPTSHGRTRR